VLEARVILELKDFSEDEQEQMIGQLGSSLGYDVTKLDAFGRADRYEIKEKQFAFGSSDKYINEKVIRST